MEKGNLKDVEYKEYMRSGLPVAGKNCSRHAQNFLWQPWLRPN